jgi:hypothetical protein
VCSSKQNGQSREIVKAEKEGEWSEADGIVDGKFHVSPYLFGKNFLETHSYVSLGTEGNVKIGKWWRIALANHYPHLLFSGLSSPKQPYQFKRWFFHIYEKNIQKMIKRLKKVNSPHVEFVQNRLDDILKSLKDFADPLAEESKPSKKVFKWALFGSYKLKKGSAIYKAIRDSKSGIQKLKKKKKKIYLKFLKVWNILYPSTDPSKAKKIITKKNK